MGKFIFLMDVTNTGLSKDHGPIFRKGDTVELNPNSESLHWLMDSGALERAKAENAADTPGNSILDQNAQNAISILETGVHSQEQLEELLAFENENKKRSTVTAAIKTALLKIQE